jgi:hypothetical protein
VPALPFRVGHGWDLHRLEPGYPLIVGGIDIPHDRGCVAHSDGNAPAGLPGFVHPSPPRVIRRLPLCAGPLVLAPISQHPSIIPPYSEGVAPGCLKAGRALHPC